MNSELLHQLALTLVPNIGDVQAKILVNHFGDASSIFKAKKTALEKIEGIGEVRAKSIKEFDDFHEHRTGKDRRKKRDQNFKKIREMKGWTLDEN